MLTRGVQRKSSVTVALTNNTRRKTHVAESCDPLRLEDHFRFLLQFEIEARIFVESSQTKNFQILSKRIVYLKQDKTGGNRHLNSTTNSNVF